MSLSLPTPDEFPAFPYSPPYPIQVELMRHLYTSIEGRKVTIVESPTGTGKTLSLLCASLTWITDEKNRARKGKMAALGESDQDDSDWVAAQTRERLRRDMEDQENEYEERLAKARKKEVELRRMARARVSKKPKMKEKSKPIDDEEDDHVYLPETEAAEDDNISPAVRSLMAKYINILYRLEKGSRRDLLDDEELTCTKIYYASRTHSQLTQIIPEMKRLKLFPVNNQATCSSAALPRKRVAEESDDEIDIDSAISYSRTVSLGSRKQLCINDELRAKKKDLDEGCRELLNEKGDKRCQFLPPIGDDYRMTEFRDQILASPKDIEDLATAGRIANLCPYFGSRRAIPQAELVTLPYNLLLQKSAREALGIDLKDQIVIIDEAHNLIPTLLALSTHKLSLSTLETSYKQVCIYVSKFRNRLSPVNLLHLKRLVAFLDALTNYTLSWKEDDVRHNQKVDMLSVSELLGRLGNKVAGINLLEITGYLTTSKVARKIANYSDKQDEKRTDSAKIRQTSKGAVPPLHAVEDLMRSLTTTTEDGKISLSLVGNVGHEDVEIKYQLLNPAPPFMELVEEARSVILAGGTMSPISDVINQLFANLPSERLTSFSCGHVIPPWNLLPLTISKGPRGGDLQYKAEKQVDKAVIEELGQIILNLTNIVPGGMIVFFPSYKFLNTSKDNWKTGGVIERFSAKKKVFFEPDEAKDVDEVLQGFSSAVRSPVDNKKGALLFAVIGAKLSEGLNFADDLARAVVIVGLPYANLASPELRERMKYVKRLEDKGQLKKAQGQKDAAAELYENMCMNAVNQSIGRAIRHRGDWASLILLDKRYASSNIRNKLPKWIGSEMKVAQTFGSAMKEMGVFFRNKKLQN
ncbi:helicase C-terminal domain-containing protein [Armillaria borealis]|uniref:ATP-dependent DNA helicase CHL1 n=1 Tax=Armillaria borealis TaxID=47425 RepID=A0AA39JGA9_9AGAR|nr:helicase C-terminal domain-containing protein [Armillaria borealis]